MFAAMQSYLENVSCCGIRSDYGCFGGVIISMVCDINVPIRGGLVAFPNTHTHVHTRVHTYPVY